MLSVALIRRELQIQSRKRATYDLRIGWGMLAIGVLLVFSYSFPAQSMNGRTLFSVLHGCLGVMLFLVAPIIAADSISREKREGTLGLLLLTIVKPWEIIFGKFGAHFTRLIYLALTFVPFLFLPVLLGGVLPQDFFFSATILLTLMILGLSAGLIASASTVRFGAASTASLVLCAILMVLASSSVTNIVFLVIYSSPSSLDPLPALFRIFVLGPAVMLFPLQTRDVIGRYFTSSWVIPAAELGLLIITALSLWSAIAFCLRGILRYG